MTTIKLCGINTPESALLVSKLPVEYMGIVHYPASPRHVPLDAMLALKEIAQSASVKTVAVTVNADDALLEGLMQHSAFNALQLHGNETPERLREIRSHFPGLTLIKAFGVRDAADIEAAYAYETTADWLLFDAKPPTSLLPGGTGQTFDWTLLAGLHFTTPWFLSGGLTAANVAEAIRITGAQAVDVSSGIESAPGIKDAAKMQLFVNTIKTCE